MAQNRPLKKQLLKSYIKATDWWEGEETVTVNNVSATFSTKRELSSIHRHIETEHTFFTEFLDAVQDGDVVYDIGAKFGLFSCFAGKKSRANTPVAFEPALGPYLRIRKNYRLNKISGRAVNVALSDKYRNVPEWLARGDSQFRLVPGDEIIAEKGLPQPNIMKIDVEGAEKFALRGLSDTISNDSCRSIFVEIHPKGCFASEGDSTEDESLGLEVNEIAEVEQVLVDAGFEIEEIHQRGEQEFWRASR